MASTTPSTDSVSCAALVPSIYTYAGSLAFFDPSSGRLLHRPAGIATANLVLDRTEGVGCFLERQAFGARPLDAERDGVDRLRVAPTITRQRVLASIQIAPTAHGRVNLRWGDEFLTADPTGEIVLTAEPHPEFSSFWLLEAGVAFDAPVSILRRGQGEDATADDFLPNLSFPQVERLIERLVGDGLYGLALNLMFHIVDGHCFLEPFHGRSLFVPGLDRYLTMISDALVKGMQTPFIPEVAGRRLIIASELYMSGGHSRVVEDLARLPGRTKIIVTDCFGNYATNRFGLSFLTRRLPSVEIVFMRRATLEHKARALLSAVAQHGPSEIYLLGHHQDPVPPAALASGKIPYRRVFLHHTDNNICLGAANPVLQHVNFTRYHAQVVAAIRDIETSYLPLCVDDLGPKPVLGKIERIRSTVTSGGQDKFSRSGALPYAEIVRTILRVIPGDHHHIGLMPDDWLDEIRRGLSEADIEVGRFKYLGVVPSLWQTLLTVDAQAYVGSAPIGGGRAAIEAQGAGYPVLFYSNPTKPVLAQVDELYPDNSLMWKDTADLKRLLLTAGVETTARSRRARRFYEETFSGAAFAAHVSRLGSERSAATQGR